MDGSSWIYIPNDEGAPLVVNELTASTCAITYLASPPPSLGPTTPTQEDEDEDEEAAVETKVAGSVTEASAPTSRPILEVKGKGGGAASEEGGTSGSDSSVPSSWLQEILDTFAEHIRWSLDRLRPLRHHPALMLTAIVPIGILVLLLPAGRGRSCRDRGSRPSPSLRMRTL